VNSGLKPVLLSAEGGITVPLMKTLTVKLPDELVIRLEKRAQRLGMSKSALVRESVERALNGPGAVEEAPSAYDLMKEGFGCVNSGVGDLATNPKHMEGFGK
jgi:predicted DNA-binding protein